MRFRIFHFLSKRFPAVAWTVFILVLMAIPGNMLPLEEKTFIPNLDKLVHATLFGVFVFLWSCYYLASKKENGNKNKTLLSIMITACLYGVATEYMQKYLIPNRDFSVFDIMADATGALIGFVIVKTTIMKRSHHVTDPPPYLKK